MNINGLNEDGENRRIKKVVPSTTL